MIDELEAFDGIEINMLMDSNPSLSDAVVARLTASFSGHFKTRYIGGQWAGASGLIFPVWRQDTIGVGREVKPTIAVDFALASTFAALMFRPLGSGWVCVSEYVYDAKQKGKTRTEGEHADALMQWLDINYTGSLNGVDCYIDPATPNSFKRLLRSKGLRVLHADNDVLSGIVTTGTRLENRDILIGDCAALKDEFAGYSWDEKAQERGEDAPVKANDHCVDALRYFAHSTGKIYRTVGSMMVNEAIQWH